MAKLRVAVLMGGRSSEHDVSLVTGKGVVDNLNKEKYDVLPVIISRDGLSWNAKSLKEFSRVDFRIGKRASLAVRGKLKQFSFPQFKPFPDVFFIALHGRYGEDGTIQGVLDLLGARYTGAGVLGSALAMNKVAFKKVISHSGITTPSGVSFKEGERLPEREIDSLGSSWVVKPANQGSSVGVSIVRKSSGLKKAIEEAFRYDKEVLVEEYLQGVEVSCGILGNKKPFALPVIEICPRGKFFDYQSKYTPGECQEIVPARISKESTKKVQNLALQVFKAVDCRGLGRVDMIIKEGRPYVLEINTIPGLTPTSLLPQEALAAGISYPELLDRIIGYALEN